MKKYLVLLLLLGCCINLQAQQETINIGTELNKLTDIQRLPQYWEGTKLYQISSYDTTGNNNDGFSGKYSFIRKTPEGDLVIFEENGSGVINRIWTPTPTDDTLDFYFGGTTEPSFSIKFSDLFTGDTFPFLAPLSGNEIGGYYCYFPIPYTDGCKIVLRGDKLEFYQIQHREYPKNVQVETFSPNLGENEKAALRKLAEGWKNIGDFDKAKIIKTESRLMPGEHIVLAEITEGGRVLGIELQGAKAFSGLNKQIDLKITWDGEKQAAVFMPLADFFGYAFGKPSMQSLLLGSANNINYCYFPMPFDKSSKIELFYRKPDRSTMAEAIQIKAKVFVSKIKRNKQEEGKFYTHWNRNPDALLGEAHVFLEGNGKGHYVGTILQSQGLNPGMTLFFEGDDITTIDGEMRVHGTGSEDYFNGGWYALLDRWDRKMSMPLHGSLDYSLPFARTGGYRLFIADKMPFEKSIRHTIEHGPEQNNMPVDYTSVAMYYADEPIATPVDIPNNSNTTVYVPNTFMYYPQLMKYTIAGNLTVDGGTLQSANGGQVRIDLSELPHGRYKLYADMEKLPDGADITVWQRQSKVSGPISFYAEEKISKPKEYLCDIQINDNRETITFHFIRDDKRTKMRINRLILVRE